MYDNIAMTAELGLQLWLKDREIMTAGIGATRPLSSDPKDENKKNCDDSEK